MSKKFASKKYLYMGGAAIALFIAALFHAPEPATGPQTPDNNERNAQLQAGIITLNTSRTVSPHIVDEIWKASQNDSSGERPSVNLISFSSSVRGEMRVTGITWPDSENPLSDFRRAAEGLSADETFTGVFIDSFIRLPGDEEVYQFEFVILYEMPVLPNDLLQTTEQVTEQKIERAIPDSLDQSALLKNLTAAAERNSVNIAKMEFEETGSNIDGGIKTMRISLVADSDLRSLTRFFAELEKMPRTLAIKNLKITQREVRGPLVLVKAEIEFEAFYH